MHIKNAEQKEFDIAFDYIERLWTYNTYDRDEMKKVYEDVLANENSFVFFLVDEEGGYHGFCHGDFFDTFWMSGMSCYLSTIITNEEERGRGYGTMMMEHVEKLARERGCKAIFLESATARAMAHSFYEKYGFDKSCYGFDLVFKDRK